ncbi:unnamed protein product [Trichogramma brassicae]|uniref:Uncharacterized protein n=1 Tax=Trichogramma brassicae TaxID=86971 RepID=A0A6H5IRZ8_9HYME|nr:unnamed protein product [Trichogramma brassicae]
MENTKKLQIHYVIQFFYRKIRNNNLDIFVTFGFQYCCPSIKQSRPRFFKALYRPKKIIFVKKKGFLASKVYRRGAKDHGLIAQLHERTCCAPHYACECAACVLARKLDYGSVCVRPTRSKPHYIRLAHSSHHNSLTQDSLLSITRSRYSNRPPIRILAYVLLRRLSTTSKAPNRVDRLQVPEPASYSGTYKLEISTLDNVGAKYNGPAKWEYARKLFFNYQAVRVLRPNPAASFKRRRATSYRNLVRRRTKHTLTLAAEEAAVAVHYKCMCKAYISSPVDDHIILNFVEIGAIEHKEN